MEQLTFDPSINVGNILVIVGFIVGGLIAWAKLTERSTVNTASIALLKAETDKSIAEIKVKVDREIAEVRAECEKEAATLHRRYDSHTEALTDSINALGIEMRAIHAENARFREKVASEYILGTSFREVMGEVRADISAIRQRFDSFWDQGRPSRPPGTQ